MPERSCLSVVLAAGEGTRMKSALPKALHKIAGLPLVAHVVRAAAEAGAGDVALVVGKGGEAVKAAAAPFAGRVEAYAQGERLGTAHAALAAEPAIARGYDDVVVMFGDAPLIKADAIRVARERLASGADVVAVGFRAGRPQGYGRLVEEAGRLVAIREDKDCSESERRIAFCNGGLMALSGAAALDLLKAVGRDNAKGEYYLTDVVEIAHRRGLSVVASEASAESMLGINNRIELAEAEAIWQRRRRRQAMLDGVTLIAPETVFFSYDTEIGADTVIEPNVWFGVGVSVGEKAAIHAFTHMEKATVGPACEVGPFARLRPEAELRRGAKVGNFCEIKKSVVEEGAKVNHLSYIGDAAVGAKANIGAGTITCNYDGFNKHLTVIGDGAFIGSNTALVAPVTVERNAYVASGSVITHDVPEDALAFGRARQSNRPGLGKRLRERLAAEKAMKQK